MDMRAQVNKNAAASQQAASTPSGCKSCERKGVAIYPLRVAAVPASLVNTGWHPAVPHQDVGLKGGEFKYALRTLREGYVYVLADKQVCMPTRSPRRAFCACSMRTKCRKEGKWSL